MGTRLVTAALAAVADHRERLTPGAVLVLTVLAHVARDDGGLAYPGEAFLTSSTLMQRRTVAGHLKALVDAGLLERVSHGSRGRRATYRLTFSPDPIGGESSRPIGLRKGCTSSPAIRGEGSEQTHDSERADVAKGASTRSPSTMSTNSSTAAGGDEVGFHRWLTADRGVNSPSRFLAACSPARLLELQADYARVVEHALQREQAQALKCRHGVVRGYPFPADPTTGRCDTCRTEAEAVTA